MSEAAKTRILFVDDEPMVLDVLRLALRPLAAEWEMTFVESGEEALDLFDKAPFDVLVSDMCMPGMTGAQLVNEVRKRRASTIRLILTAHSDEELVMKCLGSAHQFLKKPFSVPELRSTLRQIFELKRKLRSDAVRAIVTNTKCLPSVPAVYFRILDTLQQPDCSLDQIAAIVAKDPGLTTKLLQLVNSAFFGFATEVSTALDACMLLGVGTIRSLALTLHLFSAFDAKRFEHGFLDRVWGHCLKVGAVAKKIAQLEADDDKLVEQSFTAGLLHDVGKLILADGLGKSYFELVAAAHARHEPLIAAERRTFNTDHAEVGAYLLDLWGLPVALVEAVAFHHEPLRSPETAIGPLAIVHFANAVVNQSDSHPDAEPLLNAEYAAKLGVEGHVKNWRVIAASA